MKLHPQAARYLLDATNKMATDNIQPKIQEILIKGKESKKDKARCETFFYQPENIEEMKLGSLFIVAKIESSSEATHIINLLPSLIKREYYLNRRRKPLASFEASLKKANSALTELTKKGNLEWLNKIDLLCASINKNQLLFTSIGQTKAFLLRDNHLTDISKKLVPAQEKINPRKPFQSVASGKLFANDKIILTTADIFKYIPQKGLKQILESGQIDQLKTIIQENKNITSQGLVIIELVPGQEITLKQPGVLTFFEGAPLQNISQPRILKPFPAEKFISDFNLISRNLAYKIRDLWRFSRADQYIFPKEYAGKARTAIVEADIPPPVTMEGDIAPQKIPLSPPSKIQKKRKATSYSILKNLNNCLKIVFVFFRGFVKNISIGSRKIIFNSRKYSPQRQKIIISALIIALLSAAIGRQLLYNQYQKEISENQKLASQNQKKIDQMNKIIHLENLDPIGAIPASSFDFVPDQLLITEKNLIITTRQKTDVFYSFPLASQSKSGNFIPTELPKDKNWLQAVIYKNNLILLAEDNNFYSYSFTDKTSSRLSLILPSPARFQSIATFNNNLYLLDVINNQIVKCPKLESCQSWLQEKNNLSSASSLAIDGSVFVLYPDNTIVNFNGDRENVLKPEIKPFSNGFEKIVTDYGFESIYLLDKEQKRIVIIDKKGNLIKQYFSPVFEDIKDVQISPDEKFIYILSEDKIYQITN